MTKPDGERVTRKEVHDAILPMMAKFQLKYENYVANGETGRLQLSIQMSSGVPQKIQIFSEDTVELGKNSP